MGWRFARRPEPGLGRRPPRRPFSTRLSPIAVLGLKYLGNADASTRMGILEAHRAAVLEDSNTIASAINDLAAAVREVGGVE
jgi:hypothetical protein